MYLMLATGITDKPDRTQQGMRKRYSSLHVYLRLN